MVHHRQATYFLYIFFYYTSASTFFLFESVSQEMRRLQHEPSYPPCVSLFDPLLVISAALQDDEEEEDEGEMMSDHLKDSEVRGCL